VSGGPGILQLGTRFNDRYEVLRVIKSGGMGAVYEVLDNVTATRRALKVMLPSLIESDELRARFALEARVTGSIESDHIVRTSDAGIDERTGTPFLVMELLRGEELGSLVKKRGALPAEEVAIYLFQASLALDRTHAANIVHRDLKPDNLFITVRDDGSPCVKILDFGIAKVLAQHHASTVTRQMLGTPVYMAPEQLRAERTVGPAADIHALGHVAYTLLVGESYWAEQAEAIPSPYLLAAELLRGPEEPATIRARRRHARTLPNEFDAWFSKATAAKAEDRFERASTAVTALTDALCISLPRVPRVVLASDAQAQEDPSKAGEGTLPSQGSAPQSVSDKPTITMPGRTSVPARAPASTTPTPASRPTAPERPQEAKTSETRVRPLASSTDTSPRLVTSPGGEPSRRSEIPSQREVPSRRERASQRRFQVKPDPSTRILRVKVWGFWDAEEGRAYLEEFLQKAATLINKPWYVLADISEFPPQKPDVSPFVEQTMAYARENNLLKAANLVSSALTKMQISRLSADIGLPEYSFFTAEAQAVAWLLKP
jgi:serine/threonine protein kinase